jgi:uncharacterized protein YjeT (DUF2065 family)
MLKRRIEHFAALVLIGDGLLACLKPSREARAWKMGPEPWRSVMGVLARNPQLTRLVGAAQVGVGLWWVLRKEKPIEAAEL